MRDVPSSVNAPRWFDPRAREVGSCAFALNRLAALGLTFYLGLHLIVLNKLAQGANVYNHFVVFSKSPLIKVGEVILIAGVSLHGLNGLRLILHAFGIGLRQQKIFFASVVVLTAFVSVVFVIHLFGE